MSALEITKQYLRRRRCLRQELHEIEAARDHIIKTRQRPSRPPDTIHVGTTCRVLHWHKEDFSEIEPLEQDEWPWIEMDHAGRTRTVYRDGRSSPWTDEVIDKVFNQRKESDMGTGVNGQPLPSAAEIMRREARHMRVSAESHRTAATTRYVDATTESDKATKCLEEAEKLERMADLLEPAKVVAAQGATVERGPGEAVKLKEERKVPRYDTANAEASPEREISSNVPGPLDHIVIFEKDAQGYVRREFKIDRGQIDGQTALPRGMSILRRIIEGQG